MTPHDDRCLASDTWDQEPRIVARGLRDVADADNERSLAQSIRARRASSTIW
jgi:hypothetical protein